MFLARIIKTVTSTVKHHAYDARLVYVVQPVMPDGTDTGPEIVAVDYVNSNVGDTVICGGAPGGRYGLRSRRTAIAVACAAGLRRSRYVAAGRTGRRSAPRSRPGVGYLFGLTNRVGSMPRMALVMAALARDSRTDASASS